jgi:hypothetical protein
MILIQHKENQNADDQDGLTVYEVVINHAPVATFRHDREGGFAACLREAAAALEHADKDAFIRRASDAVVHYIGGGLSFEELLWELGLDDEKTSVNDIHDILGQACRDWDRVQVDAEGPSAEQDEELDAVLENAASLLYFHIKDAV